ncbi:MAG: FHIPEP family type III secretion protein [Planctomycetes bacterium]|nr:FHIPEP family type III secretion protein [Planctomycetota bacterium]
MSKSLRPSLREIAALVRSHPDGLLAAGILGILFVILIPLPPLLIDCLLIVNLTVSAVVLLTAACVSKALDFSVFPSLLLVTTFLRLSLNIATTRLILGNAAEGPMAAGKVVHTFGEFVAGENPVIGLIIFTVIVVVQFVVITKGATRVSEVAARFQLDAMPGKQLSIDGEIAAGLISQRIARDRRRQISQEADFYGAMDGASKFVRGDAVAGIIIVLINILGGIAVGLAYHGMTLSDAVGIFSRLTIGDGIVSQVPALMVSIGAALLVTRNAASEHLGKDLGRQVFSNDQVLSVVAVFLLCLLPSGLPAAALLGGSAFCALSAWLLRRRKAKPEMNEPVEEPSAGEPQARERTEPDVRALLRVAPIELEIGYRLLPLIEAADGPSLSDRIASIRERIAVELGIVMPGVQIRDTRRIAPSEYTLKLRGNSLGRWFADARGLLAVARRAAAHPLPGTPAFELDGRVSFWIQESDEITAIDEGYDLLTPVEAVALHVELVIRRHAAELLSREEVTRMLDDLRRRAPTLVDDLIPAPIKVSDLQQVLQGLLREGISIRDLESILEALGKSAGPLHSTDQCTEEVRSALARSVCAASIGADGKLHVVLLEPALEEFLLGSIEKIDGSETLALDPQTMDSICRRTDEAISPLRLAGFRPAVLCSPRIRPHFWKMASSRVPRLSVLSYEEVLDEKAVEVHGSVSLDTPRRPPRAKEEVESERWRNRSLGLKLQR